MLTEITLNDIIRSQNYLIDIAINNQLMLAYILKMLAEYEDKPQLLAAADMVLEEAQRVFKENMKARRGGVASGLQ